MLTIRIRPKHDVFLCAHDILNDKPQKLFETYYVQVTRLRKPVMTIQI